MNNNINTLINSLSKIGEIRKADKNNEEYSSVSDNTMTVGTRRRIYHYFPKNKRQLQEIIAKKIYNNGNINYECDLNDIDIRGVGADLSKLFSSGFKDKLNSPYTAYNIDMQYFNGHIENWDVSNVLGMIQMFYGCESFDQDLSDWDVSNVHYMNQMFMFCSKFNQDLSDWDVSNVKNMQGMFFGCKNFDQDISGWDVSKTVFCVSIFTKCPIKEEYKPLKFRD